MAWVDVYPGMLDLLRSELLVDAAKCFGSLADALSAVDADVVLVTTALPGHVAVALEAIAAGKHVLIEKPLAPTLDEARRVVDAAEAAGVTAMVSQNYRFYPAAKAVASLVAGGTLGAVSSASVQFRKNDLVAAPAPSAHFLLPDPLLLDMSIHHFDLMRFVVGQEPTSVACVAWNPPWSPFVDPASAIATVVFDGGAVISYSGSWVSTAEPTLWAGQWSVECEKGSIQWTGRDDLTVAGDRVTVHPVGAPSYELSLAPDAAFDRLGSVTELAASLREGREPLTSVRSNLATLELALGAIESSRSGQTYQMQGVSR